MGKEKLEQTLQATLDKGDKLFVPYIMAGDGGLGVLADRIAFLEEAGASAIELGIPFSDPVADGPTIQAAGLRALEHKVSLKDVLDQLKTTRNEREIPIILMTYVNPIINFGTEAFAEACEESGVDGLIIPDLPMEEEDHIFPHVKEKGIALIRLAALTSPDDRLKQIGARTEGFLYAVTVKGTTGAQATFGEEVGPYIKKLKTYTSKPVLAGFGVTTPDHVRDLSQYGDGVVVGSKIVSDFHDGVTDTIRELIQASKG